LVTLPLTFYEFGATARNEVPAVGKMLPAKRRRIPPSRLRLVNESRDHGAVTLLLGLALRGRLAFPGGFPRHFGAFGSRFGKTDGDRLLAALTVPPLPPLPFFSLPSFSLLFGAVVAVAAAITARWEDDRINFSWKARR
jgi:hypothetical protein